MSQSLSAPALPLSDDTVSLRLPREEDLAALTEYSESPDGLEGVWVPVPPNASPTRLAWIVEDWLRGWDGQASHNGPALLLDVADAPRFVGHVAFGVRDQGAVELVYGIAPDWRGRGLATRALVLATTWLVAERRVPVIELRIARGHRESQRVAEKAGYCLVGTVLQQPPESSEELVDLRYVYHAAS